MTIPGRNTTFAAALRKGVSLVQEVSAAPAEAPPQASVQYHLIDVPQVLRSPT